MDHSRPLRAVDLSRHKWPTLKHKEPLVLVQIGTSLERHSSLPTRFSQSLRFARPGCMVILCRATNAADQTWGGPWKKDQTDSEDVDKYFDRSEIVCFSPGQILFEKAFRSELFGDEGHYTNSLILLVKYMLCSKLH